MTNQEAIETLKANYPDACYEQLREAVDMAAPALKKQIPVKPEYKEEDRFAKKYFAWYTYCPQCGCEINAGDRYCTQCGQAIDWRDNISEN